MTTYTKHDLEVLAWLCLGPLGLCSTIALGRSHSCLSRTTDVMLIVGSSVVWALLVAAHGLSFAGILLSNLTLFFLFIHTIGFYDTCSTADDRPDKVGGLGMYLFHVLAAVGVSLVVTKVGREVSCKVSNTFSVTGNACNEYAHELLWVAIVVQVLTLTYLQISGFFDQPLIKKNNKMFRAIPFKENRKAPYLLYLVILLIVGMAW